MNHNQNQGIYFTSTFEYANRYAGISNGMKVFMISLVIPGNLYPVTEYPFKENETGKILEYNPDGFYGKACQPGYQSHFTLSLDLSFHCSNLKQTTNNTSKLVGPRDKKNQENTGPFPVQGTFDAQRDADELVVFESAQAVPLFIVYTDPAIPVVKVEEKKSSLHASFLSTLKPAEKETGLLFCLFFRFTVCQNHSFHRIYQCRRRFNQERN